MKQIYIDMTSDEDIMSSNSDDMVTIMRENNQIQMQVKQYCVVEFKFCVLFQGSIWYLSRQL